jgi:TrmH family RNA methyltransferase
VGADRDARRLTSVENPRIKEIVRLRRRGPREETGRFVVEGAREIDRALAAGVRPVAFYIAGSVAGEHAQRDWERRARTAQAELHEVTGRVYEKIAMREEKDGVLAVFAIPRADLAALRLPDRPLVLVAVGVEKPGNLGALARSADAFGADALVAAGGTDFWNPNTIRASVGSIFALRLAALDVEQVVPELRARGLRLVAASPAGEKAVDAVDLTGAVALVVGSEETGLPVAILHACDERVRVPMRGEADSLNVSVSAGILLYEADRQRRRAT